MAILARLGAAIAVAAVTLSAVPAVAQSTEFLRIQNRSGMTLINLWASARSNNSWESELLGSRTLRSGQYYEMTVRNVIDCNYDIRMEFSNGNVVTDVVNICQVDVYTIRP